MSHPLLNPAVLMATSDDGYLAYHIHSNRLHRLNATAALLVELCDGTRTSDEILAAVTPLLPADGAAECAAWLNEAISHDLLVDRETPGAGKSFSAADLHLLSEQLRLQNRVLAAYICQRSAAERDSGNPHQWYSLGELAHIVGRRDEARAAYERYFRSHPDDAEIEHLLIALRDAMPPPRASDEYIEQLYADFAAYYDDNMRGDLDYQAPELLNAALRAAAGTRCDRDVLELGCGTGLFGPFVRPWARRLTGIDLSAAMIERADERGIYDRLETAEITAWLDRAPTEHYDVIALCDTLIYFGDLRQVLPRATRHLAHGGVLGFTVEEGETFPFCLTDSGRFAHHRDHLLEVAREAGLQVVSQNAEVLRYEYGVPVRGWITVLRGDALRGGALE